MQRFVSEDERRLACSINDIRDRLNGGQKVSPDDIETLFSEAIEEGTIDSFNYAGFFVLLRMACFNTKNPDFMKFERDRVYGMLGDFLKHLSEFIDQCNAVQISIVLHSLAKMGYNNDHATINSLLERAKQNSQYMDIREIANILWVVAVLGVTDHSAVKILVEAARNQLNYFDLDNKKHCLAIDQLYRFHFVSHTLPEIENLFSRLSLFDQNGQKVAAIQNHLYQMVRAALPQQATMTLNKFIKEIRCELDIAVECDNLRFDIECDGPHHVFRRLADELNDKMKKAAGWKVFRINTTRDGVSVKTLEENIVPIIAEIRSSVAAVVPTIVASEAIAPAPAPVVEPVRLMHDKKSGASPEPSTGGIDINEDEIADSAFQQAHLIYDCSGGKVCVYAIADHLGIETQILVRRMREDWGINVTNHMSTVSFQDVEKTIRRILTSKAIDKAMDAFWKSLGFTSGHPLRRSSV